MYVCQQERRQLISEGETNICCPLSFQFLFITFITYQQGPKKLIYLKTDP